MWVEKSTLFFGHQDQFELVNKTRYLDTKINQKDYYV